MSRMSSLRRQRRIGIRVSRYRVLTVITPVIQSSSIIQARVHGPPEARCFGGSALRSSPHAHRQATEFRGASLRTKVTGYGWIDRSGPARFLREMRGTQREEAQRPVRYDGSAAIRYDRRSGEQVYTHTEYGSARPTRPVLLASLFHLSRVRACAIHGSHGLRAALHENLQQCRGDSCRGPGGYR